MAIAAFAAEPRLILEYPKAIVYNANGPDQKIKVKLEGADADQWKVYWVTGNEYTARTAVFGDKLEGEKQLQYVGKGEFLSNDIALTSWNWNYGGHYEITIAAIPTDNSKKEKALYFTYKFSIKK